MISHIIGSTDSNPSTTATNYQALNCSLSYGWNASEAAIQEIVPNAMTIDQLRITLATAPGTGKSRSFTVMVNGVASAITVTISNTATSGQDLTHSVNLNAGDTISLQTVPTGTPTGAGNHSWNLRQSATNAFALLTQGIPNNGGTSFMAPQNKVENSSTDALGQAIIPTAGVLKNLFIRSTSAAPGAGKSWIVTVFQNGVATALTATITNTNQTANDTTHTLTVSAGDTISYQVIESGTPTGSAMGLGMTFAPTTDGESFLLQTGNGASPSTSATNFTEAHGDGGNGWNSTETVTPLTRVAATTLKAMWVQTNVTPGASPKQYTFTARDALANTTAIVVVNNASMAVGSTRIGSITGLSAALADDDQVDIKSVPANTPAAVFVKTSLLTYIAPSSPPATNSGFFALMR